MRADITELREQRAGLFEQMKSLSEAAEARGEDFTAEESQSYERIEGEFDSLTRRIERREKEEGIAPGLQRTAPVEDVDPAEERAGVPESRSAALVRSIMTGGSDEAVAELRAMAARSDVSDLRSRASRGDADARRLYLATDEYRDAYVAYMRTLNGAISESITDEQRAALAVGTGATGGYTVPVEFLNELVVRQREFSPIRQLARVITTAGSGDLQVPRVGATRASAAWTGEAVAYTESEDSFEQVVLKSYKAAIIAKASEEMVHDSAFDVLGWIARSSGEAIGLLESAAFIAGASGSTTTPEGLFTKATVGVTLATGQTTTIASADSLIDLKFSVLSPYRARASWLINDASIKLVAKLKDSTNQYIWQPGLVAGQPDRLLGQPVYAVPDVAVAAANALTIGYGDVGAAYLIRDVEGTSAQALNELYAATGQVGYRVHKRTDGDLVDDTAFKTLKQSAT